MIAPLGKTGIIPVVPSGLHMALEQVCRRFAAIGKKVSHRAKMQSPAAEQLLTRPRSRHTGDDQTSRGLEMMHSFFPTRFLSSLALASSLLASLISTASAQQRAMDLVPLAGEQRMTLNLGARSVAFPSKIAPLARETVPFEAGGHAVTGEGREAMVRLQEALFRQPGGSLILVVYGENETLAFQRARAVRGELAERHSMDPARIVATGRKAEGHTGDLAIVDVFGADPTRCGGCGATPFRTIALDSGTSSLVTSFAETLPAAQTRPETRAPAPAPAASRTLRATAEIAAPTAPVAAVAPIARQHVAIPQAGGCARPRIIIDDYYPGGPMVPCRPVR